MEKNKDLDFEQESKKNVSFEKSKELAEELLKRHNDEIVANLHKDVDGWEEELYTDYQNSIEHFLEEIPEETRERFNGHGMTKNKLELLAGALNILANKSIKGYSGTLGHTTSNANLGAYTDGDFLVISRIDKGLPVIETKNGRLQPVFNEIGWIADIGAFVVNVHYYPLVGELKKMFPDVNIIKANEIPKFIETQIESVN